jgi:hypothetical protein
VKKRLRLLLEFGAQGFGGLNYVGLVFLGVLAKGLNFYRQFEVASALDPVRKVIGAASFYRKTAMCDKALIGRIAMAPLPVWFAQDHEQTLKKLSL